MPLEPSKDFGTSTAPYIPTVSGSEHCLPTANEDPGQLKATEDFLKNGILSVDIFALSAAREIKQGAQSQTEMATTFAVGEEAEAKITAASSGPAVPITAPLNRVNATVRRGDTVRVDVVVRTKKIGHFFPGGRSMPTIRGSSSRAPTKRAKPSSGVE